MSITRRLLTIGHSYVVAANRRLAHEMAKAGTGRWQVTAVAPQRFRGDLRPIDLERIDGEADRLEALPVVADRSPHFMWYRHLAAVMGERWDLVHCWEEPYVLAGAQIARAVPDDARLVVATFQNIAKPYPWPLSTFERVTMRRADAWIAFGATVHATLAGRALYAARPSRILSPGVDVERFRPDPPASRRMRERLGWSATDPVVGFVGRFVASKGLALLLDALRQVRSPWRALFVGGGPLEPDLRRFAGEHAGRVHVETGARHDDVPAWLNAMTVLAVPSQTTARWREQFGRVLVEAMACGVAVVASDSGEIPHVVGDAGVIAPEADTQRWAEALDRVLDDAALRRDLQARGLERARTRFAMSVVARELLTFFDGLSERRAA